MIKEITESKIPEELKPHLEGWQDYLRKQVESQPFVGANFQGQDKNMKAHNSKEEYIRWFCSPPPWNEHYRDNGFYPRELTMLSSFIKPSLICEMGTNLGMGTRMLSTLNPDALIVTIDNKDFHKHEEDKNYPTGYLCNEIGKITYLRRNSWDYQVPSCVDLCFIDADHTATSVKKDSQAAWVNRNINNLWAIIWHDYWVEDSRFADYCKAIKDFLEEKKIIAYHFKDSATLWTYGGTYGGLNAD